MVDFLQRGFTRDKSGKRLFGDHSSENVLTFVKDLCSIDLSIDRQGCLEEKKNKMDSYVSAQNNPDSLHVNYDSQSKKTTNSFNGDLLDCVPFLKYKLLQSFRMNKKSQSFILCKDMSEDNFIVDEYFLELKKSNADMPDDVRRVCFRTVYEAIKNICDGIIESNH